MKTGRSVSNPAAPFHQLHIHQLHRAGPFLPVCHFLTRSPDREGNVDDGEFPNDAAAAAGAEIVILLKQVKLGSHIYSFTVAVPAPPLSR